MHIHWNFINSLGWIIMFVSNFYLLNMIVFNVCFKIIIHVYVCFKNVWNKQKSTGRYMFIIHKEWKISSIQEVEIETNFPTESIQIICHKMIVVYCKRLKWKKLLNISKIITLTISNIGEMAIIIKYALLNWISYFIGAVNYVYVFDNQCSSSLDQFSIEIFL